VRRRWPGAVVAALLISCEEAETETEEEPPPVDVAGACDEVPVVTWETFGEGFLRTHCQGCHASAASDRRGAPEAFVFDTPEDAARFRSAILRSVTAEPPRMPPAGGPSDEDRERLRIWIECFSE
jgi:hypothetical protein